MGSSAKFRESLAEGLQGEGLISKWFNRRGFSVMPAYKIELSHGKGPRIFTPLGQLISPDLLVFKIGQVFWVEAKTKSAFTRHRKTSSWQTGIDRKHWHHYCEVRKQTPFNIWILFLHKPNNVAKDTPEGLFPPSGLFGNEIDALKECVDHEHDNHGPSGMVYWRKESLKRIADFDGSEIHNQVKQFQAQFPTGKEKQAELW